MGTYRTTFANVTRTEATAQALYIVASGDGRNAGRDGVIKHCGILKSSGDGTQWVVRYYRGYTGALTDEFLGNCTLPTTAGTFGNADGDEDVLAADPPLDMSTKYGDYPAGWTDRDTPRAGLGIYVAIARTAPNNDTNPDGIIVRTKTARR